jgi:hypothetical protein
MYKLNKYINKANEQSDVMSKQQLIDQNNNVTNGLLKLGHAFFTYISSLKFDWEIMELNNEGDLDEQYKIWTIVLERMDERFLPYIDYTILYRPLNNQPEEFPVDHRFWNKSIVTEIEPIEGNDVKATIKASISISYSLNIPYEVKLLINFTNPFQYK